MNGQKKVIRDSNLRRIIRMQPITGPPDGIPAETRIPYVGRAGNGFKVLPIFFSPEKMVEMARESDGWKQAILKALSPGGSGRKLLLGGG